MSKQIIIEQILQIVEQLPENQAKKVLAFAEKMIENDHQSQIFEDVQLGYAQKKTLDFLEDEDDLYSEADLKEIYHG